VIYVGYLPSTASQRIAHCPHDNVELRQHKARTLSLRPMFLRLTWMIVDERAINPYGGRRIPWHTYMDIIGIACLSFAPQNRRPVTPIGLPRPLLPVWSLSSVRLCLRHLYVSMVYESVFRTYTLGTMVDDTSLIVSVTGRLSPFLRFIQTKHGLASGVSPS
jgi:hypothetical protein